MDSNNYREPVLIGLGVAMSVILAAGVMAWLSRAHLRDKVYALPPPGPRDPDDQANLFEDELGHA